MHVLLNCLLSFPLHLKVDISIASNARAEERLKIDNFSLVFSYTSGSPDEIHFWLSNVLILTNWFCFQARVVTKMETEVTDEIWVHHVTLPIRVNAMGAPTCLDTELSKFIIKINCPCSHTVYSVIQSNPHVQAFPSRTSVLRFFVSHSIILYSHGKCNAIIS